MMRSVLVLMMFFVFLGSFSTLLPHVFARSVPLFSKKHARKMKRIHDQTNRLMKRFEDHPKAIHLKTLERKFETLEFLLFVYFQNQSSLDHRKAVLMSRPLIMRLFHEKEGWFTFANERFCIRPSYRKKWAQFWIKNKNPDRAYNHLKKGLGCGAPSSWWTELKNLKIKRPQPNQHIHTPKPMSSSPH